MCNFVSSLCVLELIFRVSQDPLAIVPSVVHERSTDIAEHFATDCTKGANYSVAAPEVAYIPENINDKLHPSQVRCL